MGFPQSATCSGRPIDIYKQHFLSEDAETGFFKLKE
jgi:hypothetical protein